nr:EOG090X08W6 [Lepidurus arcticus]
MKTFIVVALLATVALAAALPQQAAAPVPILSYENNQREDGSYDFKFETGDGIRREESGAQKQVSAEASGQTSQGSISWKTPDDPLRVQSRPINQDAVQRRVQDLLASRFLEKSNNIAWLIRAVQCIDLTTLSGDDSWSNVDRLCAKATSPLRFDIIKKLGLKDLEITTGAICVYPNQIAEAVKSLQKFGVKLPVASVATGFPSGQTHLSCRLDEIKLAVADGASEIDIVINRDLALRGCWEELYKEIKQMSEACGPAHMKAILAVGELGSLTTIYKASMVAMMAGSDFIKTSTGKEGVNANYLAGLVMCRAIRDYFHLTGLKVGFKPAGGIRTHQQAIEWLILMKEELGDTWLKPNLFRIGASGLLTDIERELFFQATGSYVGTEELPPA